MFNGSEIESTYELFDDSIEIFNTFNAASMNEANTRARIIDVIFENTLKWDKDNIDREHSISNMFIDYVFKSNKNKFIIEAKKNGIYFYIPVTNKKINIFKKFSTDDDTNNAIRQAIKYCNEKNIHIGCISNGSQFIVFNINLKSKYNGYVFNGFEDIRKHFSIFYNIFSPFANAERYLDQLLSDDKNYIRDIPQFQRSIREVLDNPDERLSRNPINQYLKRVIDTYFADIIKIKNKKIFEELYCSNKNVHNYDIRLMNCFHDHLPSLNVPVLSEEHFTKEFNSRQKVIAHGLELKSDVMLIVGGAGVGKSTFIHRFFTYVLDDAIKKNVVWLNVNLIEEGSESFDVKNFILKSCLKEIRNKYSYFNIDAYEILQEIYATEIGRMKNGSLKPLYQSNPVKYKEKESEFLFEKTSDESQFALDALKYISNKTIFKKIICISVDNADQKNVNIQTECFKTVYDLSMKFSCLIILSLREETYWKLKDVKPFDAYSSSAFHISAPKINNAIMQRLNIAIKNCKKDVIPVTCDGKNVAFEMSKFLDIVSKSFFGNEKHSNYRVFNDLCTNNLRHALNLFTTFLTSGHTNTYEYISIYLNDGDYLIPNHAIIRSLALGDYKYYNSKHSNILNVFNISNDGFFSHFTKLELLKRLESSMSISTSFGRGFINLESLFSDLNFLFSNNDSFYDVLSELMERNLVETDFGYSDLNNSKYIRLTIAGYYYINELVYKFSYMERIVEDIIIKSRKHFNEIESLTRRISDQELNQIKKHYIVPSRVERVSKLIEYLEYEEINDNLFFKEFGFQFDFVSRIKIEFEMEKERIYGTTTYKKHTRSY